MPSLIDIRRRIRAVKSTQQITKAMKMVAASKLRRAQERVVQSRPFSRQMLRMLNGLAARVDPAMHPLLDARSTPRAAGRVLLIVVTADRGLCGSFNTNVIKTAAGFVTGTPSRDVPLGLVGRRGRDFFVKRGARVLFQRINIFAQLRLDHARDIAAVASRAFLDGEVDAVHIAYNEFKSVMVQRVVVDQVLPIPRGESGDAAEPQVATEYLYEPSPEVFLAGLLPTYVDVMVFRALLESNAAFFAAQMTAMDSATRNSAEMIEQLTLYMNKVRQAAITREIIEVVSGAEAL